MKAIACALVLFAACGWADEASDRAAIHKTLESLNGSGERGALFTSDADGRAQLEMAIRSPRRERPRPTEPLEGDYWPYWPAYLERPGTVETTSIRFITPDVALADGRVNGRALLFVLKRQGAEWKIASVRFVRP